MSAPVATPSPSAQALREAFGADIERIAVSCGDTIVYVRRERIHDVLAWLKDSEGQEYDYLTDVTAVDYRDPERPLEVVWQLRSLRRKADLRLKVALDKSVPLEVPTCWDLWRGANWLERETWDMYGIKFDGHPDLRRIFLYEEFQGHPLRKDYPINRRQPLIGPKV